MTLSTKTRQLFKAKAHKLKPIVSIGNKGLTENVNVEIDRALTDHELIKIRIAHERDERKLIFNEICEIHHAEPVQLIGGIGTVYRKSDKA